MAEDPIQGLANAIDAHDEEAVKRHFIALGSELLTLLRRLADAAERQAAALEP